jgi:hypothetical protein
MVKNCAKRRWSVRLRWSQPMEINTEVSAYSELQAIYRAWWGRYDNSYDATKWDNAEAVELPDEITTEKVS